VRRRTLTGLGIALLVGIACDAGKVGPHIDVPKKGTDPDQPMDAVEGPDDWLADDGSQIWGANITVWVEKSSGPTTVDVVVTDHSDGNRSIATNTWVVEYGRFVCPVAYPARHDISFKITAKAHHPSSRGFITVREGGNFKWRSSGALTFNKRTEVELVCNSKRR
jgi:hypothetical protein